ncbi:Phospholipid scramblase [Actinidia chinensis var. chinensis]|uniref:Phospholipid scramblase n=1 Tax=Actinidia chinensis var. chinensis TaxID=1590841 RepID=A0A2R6P343_ACTCC|nr:Phospholipid scramblase [Actinidia chinensis var. chinensis]
MKRNYGVSHWRISVTKSLNQMKRIGHANGIHNMEKKSSTSSSCCFCPSSSSSSSKSKCCHKVTEFICSACMLCICCPLATAWCAIKLPCKVGLRIVQCAVHWGGCGSQKLVFAAYSSFSDIDSDTQMGKVEGGSKTMGASKSRMISRERLEE